MESIADRQGATTLDIASIRPRRNTDIFRGNFRFQYPSPFNPLKLVYYSSPHIKVPVAFLLHAAFRFYGARKTQTDEIC